MRKIIAAEFITINGVMDAVEQWHFPYVNEEMVAEQAAVMAETDTMLLGRRTYEIFAASWPSRTSGDFGPLTDFMNNTPKVVVSKTLKTVDWQNSTLLKGEPAEGLTNLKKKEGKTIFVPGSATLVKFLLKESLLDELRLLVDPILVGKGMRLFESEDGNVPLKLANSSTFGNGVLSLTYVPAAAGA